MKNIFLSILMLAIVSLGFSQETTEDWKLYPGKTDTVLPTDTVFGVIKSTKVGTIKVDKDSRIDKVSSQLRGGETKKPIINGYRVQLISSSTKATVDSEKGRFMNSYKGHKAYTSYKAPNFILRVGNFRTKLDAQKFQHDISKSFPNTYIISDEIELPRLN